MVSCDSWEIFLVATKTSFCRWAMHRTIRGEKIDIVMCPSFNTLWSNPVESLCCVPCSFLCREDLTTKGNRDSVMRWIPGGPTVQINLDNWEESIIFSSSSYSMFICCSNHEAVVKWEVSVRVCVCVCVCMCVCVCLCSCMCDGPVWKIQSDLNQEEEPQSHRAASPLLSDSLSFPQLTHNQSGLLCPHDTCDARKQVKGFSPSPVAPFSLQRLCLRWTLC